MIWYDIIQYNIIYSIYIYIADIYDIYIYYFMNVYENWITVATAMIANRKEFDGNWKCVSTTLQFRFHVPQTGDPPHCLLNLLLLHYNPGKCKFSRLWLRLVVSDWSLGYPPVYFGSKMRRSKVQRARSQIASWLERAQRHCGLNESTHFICQDYGSEFKTQTTKKHAPFLFIMLGLRARCSHRSGQGT